MKVEKIAVWIFQDSFSIFWAGKTVNVKYINKHSGAAVNMTNLTQYICGIKNGWSEI
jgi:hypothetical protein